MLKDDNRHEVMNPAGTKNIILHYFKSIYTSNNSHALMQDGIIDNVLRDIKVTRLSALFTHAEVLKTLKHMKGSKSPGPDGLQACFLHKCCPVLGEKVRKMFWVF